MKKTHFHFNGNLYTGDFETALDAYINSQGYKSFSEFLNYEWTSNPNHKEFMASVEKEFIESQLRQNRYQISNTSIKIGISRQSIYDKIKSFKITLPRSK